MVKTKQKTRKWARVSWQGISFPVLEDWNVTRVQGDRQKGYLRIDDDERVRMEVRWEKPVKKSANFSGIASRMLSQLHKFSRKKKSNYTIKRNPRVAAPAGKEYETFETRGDGISYGCLTRCKECGRIVLARVIGKTREDLKSMARKIFEEMTDHADADGLDHWEIYDLKFGLPPRFRLQKAQMRTGALELAFNDKKMEVDVRRLGLAKIVLKERSLKNFFINYCYKDLKKYQYQTAEVQVKGHDGIALTGPQTLHARVLSNLGLKRYVHAYCWVCDDKIYVFKMTSPREEEPLFFELAEHVRCHEETDDED